MKQTLSTLLTLLAVVLVVCIMANVALASNGGHGAHVSELPFPLKLEAYHDSGQGVLDRLHNRIAVNPFNLVASIIFLFAVIHTFLCGKFTHIAHRLEAVHKKKQERRERSRLSVPHRARLMHFIGEVEVVFGLWAVVLFGAIFLYYGWDSAVGYATQKINYTEAMFVVVIMTLASTRPILKFAELIMDRVAKLFGGSLSAWWFSILTLGPLLGSFITEPAAMTIAALLLKRKFYELNPSDKLKYATLGLLFVNVSVGGTLTHFAAPPVLMVAEPWGWDMGFMFGNFGWKALVGIIVSNMFYWFAFKKEFADLKERFAIRDLKDDILTKYFSREDMEAEIEDILNEARTLGQFRESLKMLVDGLLEKLEHRLEEKFLKNLTEEDEVDSEMARKAFEERFNEIKLYQLRRDLPSVLPPEEQADFQDPDWDKREDPVPAWVIVVHLVFMLWTIVNVHYPVLFIAGLLFFLGFAVVTSDYQNNINLKSSLLVGFFLGGLVTLGGAQGWWIEPVLSSLSEMPLMIGATILTAFNDNAAITYLSTLVPDFTYELKYAVVAGAVTGGGLTVIANAPNPAGQAILKDCFKEGVSPIGLMAGALIPTLVMFAGFSLL